MRAPGLCQQSRHDEKGKAVPSAPKQLRHIDRPVPLRQRTYEAILEMIVDGTLEAGQHLVEGELATMLGVSRQPVREALQSLAKDGWVDLRPALGAFVHQPSLEEAAELLVVRRLLESESARLAAEHATPADVGVLQELCRVGFAAAEAESVFELVEANAALHRTIAECSRNRVLVEMVSQIDRRVRWLHGQVATSRGVKAWQEHASVVDAIAHGDATLAAELMRAHIDRARANFMATVESTRVAHDAG